MRAQMQSQAEQLERAAALEGELVEQQRQGDSLQSQLLEQQQTNDHLQRETTLAHIQLEESREAFRVRIQHCMLEVGAAAVAREPCYLSCHMLGLVCKMSLSRASISSC